LIRYISYPIHVGFILLKNGYDDELIIAGILHDVCEDADIDINSRDGFQVLILIIHFQSSWLRDLFGRHDLMEPLAGISSFSPEDNLNCFSIFIGRLRQEVFIQLQFLIIPWK
jgi:hypothetical protein